MKLAVTIILITSFQALAINGTSQKRINLDLKNATIPAILERIESKYDYRFFYNEELSLEKVRLDLYTKNATIDYVMERLLVNTSFSYKKVNNSLVVIIGDPKIKADLPIKGKIVDKNGAPLARVSIVEKGTLNGAVTNDDGTFSLNVKDENAVLIVTNVGYEILEIPVTNIGQTPIVLASSENRMDEVVVVGYGTQKRETVTGAVSSIKSEDLVKAPIASPTNALAGRLPGLVSLQQSGLPGSDAAMLSIRGFGNALVIVDGVEGDFRYIDPNQIENISILKDASAAIYGSRAGNGVILITTKRGNSGKPVLTFDVSRTAQGITVMPKPVNAWQYATLAREEHIQAGRPDADVPFTEEQIAKYKAGNDIDYPNTDWYNEVIRKWAPQQQYSASVRGGNEAIKYYALLGYLDQEAIYKKNGGGYKRYNFITNVDAKISNSLSMEINLSSNIDNRLFSRVGINSGEMSVWGYLWQTLPIYPASLPDPTKVSWANGAGTAGAHVISNMDYSGYNKQNGLGLNGSFALNYKVKYIDGLSLRAFGNYSTYRTDNRIFIRPVDTYRYIGGLYIKQQAENALASLTASNGNSRTLNGQLSLNYEKRFNNHYVKALALYELMDYKGDWIAGTRNNFITPLIEFLNGGSDIGQKAEGSGSEMGRVSYVGRLNYTFKDKYLLESILRADASAKFPANARWGYFPGVSVGWNIHKENFMNGVSAIDNLKLRASYGAAGRDDVGNFAYVEGYGFYFKPMLIGNVSSKSLITTGLPNINLTWEKIKTYNAGLDFSIFKSKLYGEAEVFYRMREGILANRLNTLPSTFGSPLPPENINSQNDRGFELKLGTRGNSSDWRWDVSGNVSWSRAKWVHFEEPDYTDPELIRLAKVSGAWTDRNIGYLSDGLFTSEDEIKNYAATFSVGNDKIRMGDLKIKDLNGDGKIDQNDQTDIGKGTMPHWMFGFAPNIRFKNFDFAALVQGAAGYYTQINYKQGFNYASFVYDNRWTPENNNKNALVPRLGTALGTKYWHTDYNYRKADYVRLKMVSLGYSIPTRILENAKIQRVRIYIAGTNLFTLSGLNKFNLDPEAPSDLIGRYYPQQKTVSIGANISF